MSNQDRDVESVMIKAMAVAPTKRFECETRLKDMLRVGTSQTLKEGGINFVPDRLVVVSIFGSLPFTAHPDVIVIQADARVLPAPTISYAGVELVPSSLKVNAWEGAKYIRAKDLDRWSLIAVCTAKESFSETELR